jgi:hypothetical protein
VVWQDGAIVFDHHPSRAGLVGAPSYFSALRSAQGKGQADG